MICVYCGKRQPKDVTPDPIAFKSTFGYQWLLQSLDLDGSETVGPSIDENELYRGRNTPKEEISVSDLLSLEIPWPAESELSERSLANNELVQTKSPLNLAGVDLDNFFTEPKRDLVSHSMEDPRANSQSESVEMNAFSSQENVNLFQNVHQPSTAASSSEMTDNDGFSGWEADFQSADSGNQHEVSRSFDTFAGSTVDLSAHMDSVFGSGKDLEDEKTKHASNPLQSASDDQIQDGLWNNVNILTPHQGEQADVTISSKGLVAADNLYSHPSTSTDWLPDEKWQSSGTTAPENKTTIEDEDSFDIWNDFTSSTNAHDPFKNSLIQSSDQIASGEQISDITFSSSTNNFQEMDFSSLSQQDLFSGHVSDQTSSVETNIVPSEVLASDRLADVKVQLGGNVAQAANDGDIFNSETQSEHDVESILSQMHDLSFMLKSDLSVPSK